MKSKTIALLMLSAMAALGDPCSTCTAVGATSYKSASPLPESQMSFGPRMVFTVPVENGVYEITLRFMEPNRFYVGARLFNVTVNDQPMLWNFDIFAAAGTNPTSRALIASAVEGKIVVTLTSALPGGNAVLSELWVQPVGIKPE